MPRTTSKKPERPTATTVCIADDSIVVREGFRTLFSNTPGFEIVAEATVAAEVASVVKKTSPDILIVDLRWHSDNAAGIAAIQDVRMSGQNVQVVAVSAYEHLLPEARRAGADAALSKDFSVQELMQTIRNIKSRVQMAQPPPPLDRHESFPLSPREREIMALVIKGFTDKQIATTLERSVSTVKNHMKHTFAKLNARNRTQAAHLARRQGLLETKNTTE